MAILKRKRSSGKKASWRITTLAKHKYFTPKVTEPYEFKNIIYPSTLTGRRPERVLAAAYPYERILLDTRETFADVLTERSKKYIELVLANTATTIYANLVKRPVCAGRIIEEVKRPEWTPITWKRHKERILSLATPKKDFSVKTEIQKREYRDLESLMPRIISLSVPPVWRVYKRLSQEPMYKDPTKLVNRGALYYKPTERMLQLSIPKKIIEDTSLRGLMEKCLWEKFVKRADNAIFRAMMREKAKREAKPSAVTPVSIL